MVAGIGCRAGVSVSEVEAAIDAAIAEWCARKPAEAIAAGARTLSGAKAAADRGGVYASASPMNATADEGQYVSASPMNTTADEGEHAAASAKRAAASTGEVARAIVTVIATPAAKAKEPGLQAAAAAWGVPLLAISQEALEAANPATVTRSERSMAAMNVHSVAEAAALAGAAANGMNPCLLQPRIIIGPVTCALADTTTS